MRLLLDAEVVAHAVFHPDVGEATLRVPERQIELRLKNLDVARGTDRPLLEAQLVFESESFDTGLDDGKALLKELLSSLSYVTSLKFEFYRAKRLINWSDGDFAREFLAYQRFPGQYLPNYVLTSDLLQSACAIWKVSKDHPLESAVHWFASGVKATSLEDQFQLFWFSVEILATYGKDPARVNDLCATCGNPLYCQTCGTHPEHRPFPKQAIEQMFRAILSDEAKDVSPRLFKVRNMLMHGATIAKIEEEVSHKLEDCVEDIAQIAKRALFMLLEGDLAQLDIEEMQLLWVDGYAHMTMVLSALMSSSSIPPDISMLDRLALPEMKMVFGEAPQTDQSGDA